MKHRLPRRRVSLHGAFTLMELLVSMSVLLLLLTLCSQLFNGASSVAGRGNRQMDADEQARVLLDRMGVDFTRMVRRADVDYYLKGRPAANQAGNAAGGTNDQVAFYSGTPGYSPNNSTPSPLSLVAYRVNAATQRLERLGKGLVWNGDSSAFAPMVFLPVPLASPLPSPLPSPLISPTPATSPTPAWPAAGNADADVDYEPLGPQVFRFEYYYLLKGQTVAGTSYGATLSDTPWDKRITGHVSVNALQDVAAVVVAVAIVDPRSRRLLSDAQLSTLAGQMYDFTNSMFPVTSATQIGGQPTQPGDLETQWQKALDASPLPRAAASAIRIYNRYFYLAATND